MKRVVLNLDFARMNMKSNIYSQAVLEGVAASFPQTEEIIDNGNKRAAVIFANHYLISKGEGFIVIPEDDVPEFKKLLVAYYEDKDNGEITGFLKTKCWKTF